MSVGHLTRVEAIWNAPGIRHGHGFSHHHHLIADTSLHYFQGNKIVSFRLAHLPTHTCKVRVHSFVSTPGQVSYRESSIPLGHDDMPAEACHLHSSLAL